MNLFHPFLFGHCLLLAFVPGLSAQEPIKEPIKEPVKLPSVAEREKTVRLQVFLDRALFGPGKVDGLPGEFTTKATAYYQQAHGLEANGLPDNLALSPNSPLYTTYTLRAADQQFIGECPSKPVDQAKKKSLPYDSFQEFISERFHCSTELLAALNPELRLENLKVDDTLIVPAVEPFQIEDVRAVASVPEVPDFKNRLVQISRKERILQLKDGDRLVATFPITPGSNTLPTPPGKWRLVGIATMPNFRWDEGVLNHGVRTESFFMLPPGPNNPVGVAWCALSKPGIGIHGTNQPETIGRASSHGCMRVANWDVIRLVKQLTSNIPVVIE